ncbi:hypothetical protein NSQ91_25720 [Paenibacillus sp. FSL R7-0048]|uniref:lipopolysaccharide biosynthesis protein n=1 Tax=Paenibacillus TaxID=44249 RepID=UPI00096DEAAC|nr:hypothetical protein [Paenibacillus odorifer]OMD63163.1 hypothetical protein BSK48_26850 [Paenibacillus odorifer]
MNNKAIIFIKNFSYTISSNLLSLIISTLVILLIPKLIGVENYGHWQLYLFYSSYVGFLQFGWNDGIYLRYGGREYQELNKGLFFSQFYMLVFMQLLIVSTIFTFLHLFPIEVSKIFIFQMTAICMLIVNVRYNLLYILQGTNRIREYARITMLDRILYFIIILILLIMGIRDYKLMIAADLTGKLISLFYAMYYCKDIVFQRFSTFYLSINETIKNTSVGVKLMFANIASVLIIGVIRFGIERSWDVSTFGKVSLTLSISNLMMLFINAVGLIVFPILRRTNEIQLPSIYEILRTLLMAMLFAILMLFYPLKETLSVWLPQYSDTLMYMAILFPMCIYEGKMSLLINTYLKTLRKEKLMLKINLTSLAISVLSTLITTIILKNLNLAILSIVIILAFRCALAEILLTKILGISIYKEILLESIMVVIFILLGWFFDSWVAFMMYGLSYVMYIFIKRKDIIGTIKNVKLLLKS